ncbi:MAG: hypothetical protein KHX03_09765 [Clostridium sp.]|nr:hypothetical protein [Clostridium sp.]
MEAYSMYIPKDLKRSFKAKASKEGKSMCELINEWIASYVQEKQREKTA